MDLILLSIIVLLTQATSCTAATVPCTDRSTSCTPSLCGRFEQITYDVCRKTCDACDGPTLDNLLGIQTPEPTTNPTTTTTTTTTEKTTTRPPTTQTTTKSATSTTTTTTTPRPTTATTTTKATTIPATTTSITKSTTLKTTTNNVPCVDKITSCQANANAVCGNDDHFTYDLCRKTCGQCNGPAYTTPTPLTITMTTTTSGIDPNIKEIQCYYVGGSQQYDGDISQTSPSNHTCVNWANIAALEGYTAQQFPDSDLHHNFCRDPTNTGRPFCHTLYGKESCGITECMGPCQDSGTVSCALFGTSACTDEELARTLCPVTCQKCGYGLILTNK